MALLRQLSAPRLPHSRYRRSLHQPPKPQPRPQYLLLKHYHSTNDKHHNNLRPSSSHPACPASLLHIPKPHPTPLPPIPKSPPQPFPRKLGETGERGEYCEERRGDIVGQGIWRSGGDDGDKVGGDGEGMLKRKSESGCWGERGGKARKLMRGGADVWGRGEAGKEGLTRPRKDEGDGIRGRRDHITSFSFSSWLLLLLYPFPFRAEIRSLDKWLRVRGLSTTFSLQNWRGKGGLIFSSGWHVVRNFRKQVQSFLSKTLSW